MKFSFLTKIFSIILVLLLMNSITFSKVKSFSWKDFKYCDLSFNNSKMKIIKKFGKPKQNVPEYECGNYATGKKNPDYYQLIYKDIICIGNDKEGFIFESIILNDNNYIMIGDYRISNKTSKNEFIKHFNDLLLTYYSKEELLNREVIQLFSKDTDDCAEFYFKNGKVFKFNYWSPC
ncbi:MAG TPA: hypothetical protein PK419_08340 [Spirochaetota bacterium]|nr:hypothetical protein [Spirochaetota bacterium]HOH37576.1 hypothetical protein [Spirochaetota bacterium]HQA52853.1 hypothetical protein [Spirochaetota bacterium]